MTDDGRVIRRLFPRVQPYAWGSPTAMTELLHIASTGGPMAELWLGDHPLLPSNVGAAQDLTRLNEAESKSETESETKSETETETETKTGSESATEVETLDQVLLRDPQAWFDPASLQRGTNLSFLLKVMAIAEPLSLQTHPNLAQAQEGFAREDALGISRTAPNRNYRDANHKPELICALTEMDALSGFRPVPETLALLNLVDDPAASMLATLLAAGLGSAMQDCLSGKIFPNVQATESFATASRNAALAHPEQALTFGWWAALCDRHAGDGGVAVAALLHCVRLQPGEGLFLGAGNMHAYLSGVGIEIMANSDNVLRGGLTPKHVDVEELLIVTKAESGPVPLVTPVDVSSQVFAGELAGPNVVSPGTGANGTGANGTRAPSEPGGWLGERWPVPVEDFQLVRISGNSIEPRAILIKTRPLIALCTQGAVSLTQGVESLNLGLGESAVVGIADDLLGVSGNGTVFLASAG